MAVPQLSKKAIVEQAQPKKNEQLVNKMDVDIPKAQSSCANDKDVTSSVNCVDESLNGIKQTTDEPIKPEIATVVEMETNSSKTEIHVVWKKFLHLNLFVSQQFAFKIYKLKPFVFILQKPNPIELDNFHQNENKLPNDLITKDSEIESTSTQDVQTGSDTVNNSNSNNSTMKDSEIEMTDKINEKSPTPDNQTVIYKPIFFFRFNCQTKLFPDSFPHVFNMCKANFLLLVFLFLLHELGTAYGGHICSDNRK